MKAFVITLLDIAESISLASRAMNSAKKNGLEIYLHKATTKYESLEFIERLGLPIKRKEDEFGDLMAIYACFLSHHSLWVQCVTLNEPIVIMEHDAVLERAIPNMRDKLLVNLGKPSYGKIGSPELSWTNYAKVKWLNKQVVLPLYSKKRLPGTHLYYLSPKGAKELVSQAPRIGIDSVDHYINKIDFPFLCETYPWCGYAESNFSTIQHSKGLLANHSYQACKSQGRPFYTSDTFWETED